MNVADALDRNTIFFPDNEALIDGDRRWTYRDLRRDADRVAHALAELGIGKGDRVCLYMSNCAEFAIAFYGILKLGAVAVSLSAQAKRGEVEYMVNNCEARVLIAGAGYLDQVPERSAIRTIERVVSVGGDPRADHELWSMMEGRPESFATVYTDREDGAEIIYTGGTTGSPKGVLLTHGNVVSNANAQNHVTGQKPEDRLVCFLPMYHSFAQNFIFNSSVNCGSTLIIFPRFELEPVMETMRRERATRWLAVPTIYILVLNAADTGLVDRAFESVTWCFSAAAPMPAEVARQWKERFGLSMVESYGLTESTPMAVYNHEHRHKDGSVGTPIENVEVQIWSADGTPAPPGESGEIVIKGPNVMKCYFNNPEATAETLVDGWLKTGDIGVMDEEGYFFIVDRLKDMVNSAGLKIWPREVEEVLYQHAGVAECAVIGVPDELYGESVKACVVLQPGVEVCEDDLIAYCKERLSSYKAPKMVEFVEGLPKSAAGKILKTELRRMAQPSSGATKDE